MFPQQRGASQDQSPTATPPSAQTSTQTELSSTWGGWLLLGILLVMGAVTSLFILVGGILIFAAASFFVATCLHEVRAPDEAFLFRFGKFIGRLKPGWYPVIPHLWDIVLIPMGWRRVGFSDPDLYTGDEPPIVFSASGVTFFRPLQTKKDREKILLMPPDEMAVKVEAVALAILRREFGRRATSALLREKKKIETAARAALKTELGVNGYEPGDYEISRMKSRQIETRAQGRAQGDATKSIADPLKDNYPGAIGVAAHAFAEPAGQALADFAARQIRGQTAVSRPPDQSGTPGQRSSPQSTTVEVPADLADRLRNFFRS